MSFRKTLTSLFATLGALALMPGCSSAPKNAAAAANLEDAARTTLNKFESQDRTLVNVLDTSAGYVVFPSVGKAGFIFGGAYGKGVVYQHGQVVGNADIKQASVGLQVGAQDYDELVVFRDPEAINRFKKGSYSLSAEASAVALKAGAAAEADFKQGVAVFTMTNSGLMAEAAVAGQRFGYTPADASGTSNDTTTTETRETVVHPSDPTPTPNR